jgi:hypothetical protein
LFQQVEIDPERRIFQNDDLALLVIPHQSRSEARGIVSLVSPVHAHEGIGYPRAQFDIRHSERPRLLRADPDTKRRAGEEPGRRRARPCCRHRTTPGAVAADGAARRRPDGHGPKRRSVQVRPRDVTTLHASRHPRLDALFRVEHRARIDVEVGRHQPAAREDLV